MTTKDTIIAIIERRIAQHKLKETYENDVRLYELEDLLTEIQNLKEDKWTTS